MIGNVVEWCADWYSHGAYSRYRQGDIEAPDTGSLRVVRGGCPGFSNPDFFRCAYRVNVVPGYCDLSVGFRLARALPLTA